MLKFNYTETGIHLEHLTQSIEGWMARRAILALRAGQDFRFEPGIAAFLLPAHADLRFLEATLDCNEAIAFCMADAESIEVSLRGIWLSSQIDAFEGVFVATLGYPTELAMFQLWQASQPHPSSVQP